MEEIAPIGENFVESWGKAGIISVGPDSPVAVSGVPIFDDGEALVSSRVGLVHFGTDIDVSLGDVVGIEAASWVDEIGKVAKVIWCDRSSWLIAETEAWRGFSWRGFLEDHARGYRKDKAKE